MENIVHSLQSIALSDANLNRLPVGVARPIYDRASLKPGILHVGLGNFHRAHQAWYLHRLMQDGLAQDWAIIGAGVRPYDAGMRQRLLDQDCLTTLIELSAKNRRAEVIGSMIDYLPIEDGNASLIAKMAEPSIRIVSLTVTESGYFMDPATGGFDATHEDIQHDVANPHQPRTVFGAIVAALHLRQVAGNGPVTIQSCDNLRGNGDITRQTVASLARLTDTALAEWIDAFCSFPNSMVDCIVPATGSAELALVREIGIADAAPVTHENYRQWVIEDDFCAGRPDWDKAGAIFSPAVHDYETMKIRVLNAGHQVLANAGEILGVETIAESMAHPLIAALFRKVETEEIVPYVTPVPGMTPEVYAELIATRFSNPAIRDTTRRVAFDGSSRHPGFVVPILHDALAAGGSVQGLALVEALWARMCAGIRDDGTSIRDNDPMWDALVATARKAKTRPLAWLEQSHIYGALDTDARFADAFCYWLAMLWDKGTAATLAAYTGNAS